MEICALSDLHGFLPTYVKPCEVIFICGDISPLNIQSNIPKMEKWLKTTFFKWVDSLPCEKVFLIAGNHDIYFERRGYDKIQELLKDIPKLTYLENNTAEYVSKECILYTIHGTPECTIFGNWAFMKEEETLDELFSKIPNKCDILITHDAPYGTSDICYEAPWIEGKHVGNPSLTKAIIEKCPTYVFHGHLHSSNHDVEYLRDTKVYNVSILNERYDNAYYPLYLNI